MHVCVWWKVGRLNPDFRKQCRLTVKLLIGDHGLNAGRQHHKVKTKLCQLCDSYDVEDVSHLLFKCDSLSVHRDRELPLLIQSMPGVMGSELQNMNTTEQTAFRLGGMRSGYIPEWNDTLVAVAYFVAAMYSHRRNIM